VAGRSASGQKRTQGRANLVVRLVPEADVRLQFGSNLLAKKSVVSENNNKPRSMQWQRLIVS
jgi:hypothetical protein